jgi:hypothetical protein
MKASTSENINAMTELEKLIREKAKEQLPDTESAKQWLDNNFVVIMPNRKERANENDPTAL